MVSSGLLRRVALVRTTRRNNPEDTILHSHRRENLKSYFVSTCLPVSDDAASSDLVTASDELVWILKGYIF
jgi:hypothetical protein